jgi:hypothetical protein
MLMLSGLFRPRRRAADDDEKQSRLPILRSIPTPVAHSEIHSYGHDYATESRSRALLANDAGIVVPTQTSPTSLGIIRPRSSIQVNTGTPESLSRAEDESGSHHNIRAPLSPFGSQIESDVRNLTGQIVIDTYRPVFEGNYSSVYRGVYGDQEVWVISSRLCILTPH